MKSPITVGAVDYQPASLYKQTYFSFTGASLLIKTFFKWLNTRKKGWCFILASISVSLQSSNSSGLISLGWKVVRMLVILSVGWRNFEFTTFGSCAEFFTAKTTNPRNFPTPAFFRHKTVDFNASNLYKLLWWTPRNLLNPPEITTPAKFPSLARSLEKWFFYLLKSYASSANTCLPSPLNKRLFIP